MSKRVFQAALFLIVGCAYWQIVSMALQIAEPWDSPDYWSIAYPLSLLLAAVLGAVAKREGWLAGVLVIFAQLPVMLLNRGPGALLPAGLIFLVFLAIPAAAVAALAGWFSNKPRPN